MGRGEVSLGRWVKGVLLARELRAAKEKLMGHRAKTWIEGLLVAVAVGLLGYVADNAALLFGAADRKALYAGIITTALAAARGYVAARYAIPPDVKEALDKTSEVK